MPAPLVLNLDRNPHSRQVRTGLLRALGFEVVEAVVADARRIAAQTPVALILSSESDASELANVGPPVISIPEAPPDGSSRDAALQELAQLFENHPGLLALWQMEFQRARPVADPRFERLKSLSSVGVITCANDRITDSNAAFLEMLGCSPDDAPINWREIITQEYAAADRRALEELRSQGACTPFEAELLRKDGSRLPILVGMLELGSGSHAEWIAYVVDLSERKRIEERLFQKAKIESVGLLAGGLAHRFNNWLTSLMGNLSLVFMMLPRDGAETKLLQKSMQAAEKMAELTRQLLAYAGKGQFVVEPVNLSELVRAMEPLLRTSFAPRIELQVSTPKALPNIQGDSRQLEQVVLNLVMNAQEAIDPESGGRVRILTWAETLDQPAIESRFAGASLQPGEYACLRVSDTGCGMDSETRARIFDPFFSTKSFGRGLGLAAVAGVVRILGGGITIATEPNEGSEFTIYLPVTASA